MNLEQLYQERFQSFEKKPSSDISLRMQKKISHVKTLQLIKWIAIGAVITATAVALSIFSLSSDEPKAHRNTNEDLSLIEHSVEKPKSQSLNTQIVETKHKENTKSLIENEQLIEETNTLEKPTEEQLEAPTKQNDVQEFIIIAKEEEDFNGKNSEPLNESQLSAYLDKIPARSSENLDPIEFKILFLQFKRETRDFDREDLNLTPTKHFTSLQEENDFGVNNQSGKKKSKNKTLNWNAYLDLHFSPLIWENKGNIPAPDLDTSWTYSMNHHSQLSYEFGFSFQLHHKKTPLFLQLGFDYQILKEKIDFQTKHTFEDPELSYWTYDSIFDINTIIDTIYIIVDSNQFIIDTLYTQNTVLSNIDSLHTPVMSSEEKRKEYVNTYTYLNIPLLLGYQFQTKNKKWDFQILAGAIVAINLNNQGYYYTTNGDFKSYSGKVTPSLVWNFSAAASVSYHLKKWHLFIQPEFQYQLNESQISNQPHRRKYQFYKIKFGIRYQLF